MHDLPSSLKTKMVSEKIIYELFARIGGMLNGLPQPRLEDKRANHTVLGGSGSTV